MKLRQIKPDRPPHLKTAEACTSIERSEYRFDSRVEMSPSDLQNLMRMIESAREVNICQFAEMAARLVVLFPERRADLGLTDALFEEINALITVTKDQEVINVAKSLAVLFPERRAAIKSLNDFQRDIKSETSQAVAKTKRWKCTELAAAYAILFPGCVSDLNINEADLNGIMGALREYKEEDIARFWLWLAANVATAFPEQKSKIETEGQGEKIQRDIESARERGDWVAFLKTVYYASIIYADVLRISDQGIELIYQSQINQPTPLPLRKAV